MTDERRVPENNRLDENDGNRFDRLPPTPAERTVSGRVSRAELLEWWDDRYGMAPEYFDDYTFWEKGAGKIWIFADDTADPIEVEGLGMTFARTRQRHWKPTTSAACRFGAHAERNVLVLDGTDAATFARGEDLEVEWDGDWGYLIVAHEMAGWIEPIGIGLYLHDELQSMIPKGRRESLAVIDAY